MDTIRIIKTKEDHLAAAKRLDELFELDPNPDPESDIGLEAEALILLIKNYEDKQNFLNTDHVTALDIIKFLMEQNDLTTADMKEYLGNSVPEVLNGKRPLTLSMMRKLHKGLNVPADVLLSR